MPPLAISDVLSQVETSTLKVLFAPEKKDRWMVLLKGIRETVAHDPQFQLLIENIMRLIEGEPAETLKPQLKEPYASSWARLVDACVSAPPPTTPDGDLRSLVDRLNRTPDPAERIPLLREALRLADREKDPGFWGQLQLSIGQGLAESLVGDRRQQLEEAIERYGLALEVMPRETSPEAWAHVKMCQGNALEARVEGDEIQNVEDAIARYGEALEVYTQEVHPGEWALTNMNLGIALYNRKTGDAADNVERAISTLSEAGAIITPETAPGEWVKLMVNIANAYLKRVKGDRAENVEFAVRSLRQALSIIAPEHAPAMWVTVAVNLACAESERSSGDRLKNLEEAQRTLLAAERLCDPRTAPVDWFRLSLNLNEVLQKTIPLLRDAPAKLAAAIKEACRRIWKLYGDTGEGVKVLENALRTFTLAVELTPENSPDLSMYLVRQGILLEDTAKADKSVAGLDQAVKAYERAVQLTPPGSRQAARNLNSLSLALSLRAEWTNRVEDLRRSVEKLWIAIEQSSSFPDDKRVYVGNMKNRLETLYAATNSPEDLEQIGRCHNEMLGVAKDEDDQIDAYARLGYYRMRRYAGSQAPEDLDEAIEQYEKAIALVDDPVVRHSLFLAASSARHIRFQEKNNQADLETAVQQLEEADVRAPDDAPEKFTILNNGGAMQVRLFELTNDIAHLDNAIEFLERIPALKPPDAAVSNVHLQLAHLHKRRYAMTGDTADLRSVLRYEVQYLPSIRDEQKRELQLIEIGADHTKLFLRTENASELEQAISCGRALVETATRPEFKLAGRSFLVDFLFRHYRLTAQMPDLEEGLERAREAGRLCTQFPQFPELFLTIQAQTAGLLRSLYERTENGEYRREGSQILDEVRKRVEAGEAAETFVYETLGRDLLDRFAVTGELSQLETSLEYHKRSIAVCPDEPKPPAVYTNLGDVLSDLYSATGNLQYLDQAIDAWSEAVRLSAEESPYFATRLNNLGSGFLLAHRHSHNPKALDSAIELTRKSVDIPEAAAVNLPLHLYYLAQALLVRYDERDVNADLDEAITVLDRALGLATARDAASLQLVALFGQALRLQYLASSDYTVLKRSIETLSSAIHGLPQTSRFYPELLAVLGGNYQSLYERDGLAESRQLMRKAYREACQSGLASRFEIVLSCSRSWGEFEAGHDEWATSSEAYRYGIDALAKLYRAQVLRSAKETWLSDGQRIHSQGAFAMARAGLLEQAVEVLEAGRARLLVEVIERQRAELQRLPELGHAEEFAMYSHAVGRLAYFEQKEAGAKGAAADSDIVSEISTSREQLEETVEKIRNIPGFEHLFAAPSFEQIRQIRTFLQSFTGRPAMVLYLLVVERGGIAILLEEDKLQAIEFPLTEADLDTLMIPSQSGKADGYLSLQFAARPNRSVLETVLNTVGRNMMQAVVAHLPQPAGGTDDARPTLVLVPAGRLALLPLHAVPCGDDLSRWTLLDRYEVTFMASLRSLKHCIERARIVGTPARTLSAVANPLPLPAGFAPLGFARPEVEEIAKSFAGPNTLLCETDADRQRLDGLLDAASYLHFSCHGLFDPNDPMLSGIPLSDGQRFTLRDLVSHPELEHARLAVLSACQTAITEFNRLPEEAIGLPSGFLQAGLAGVIGSLWPVQDISTALLMIQFYHYHLHGEPEQQIPPQAPMQALRKAQLWLRDLTNAKLADLFNGYRKSGDKTGGITSQLAQTQFQSYALSPPKQCPYASPYYWAAFGYFGV